MEELKMQELENVEGGGILNGILIGVGVVALAWAAPVALAGGAVAGAVVTAVGAAATTVGTVLPD